VFKHLFLLLLTVVLALTWPVEKATAAGCDPNNIIFSEIDYDQPSTDTQEFLELRIINATTISNCELRLINGANNTTYDVIDLSGTWGPNHYLAIGSTNIPNRDLTFGGGTCAQNCLQNGSPDGFALVDTASGAGTVVWFYSYEGTITGYDAGDGVLVDSTPLPVSENNRSPNRAIINGPNPGVADATTTENPTPGAPNQDSTGAPTRVHLLAMQAAEELSNGWIIALLTGFSALLFLGFWLRRRKQ
jgi:hypothetical protein